MATTVQDPPKLQGQMVRSDPRMFSSSDDNAMMKQIQATHSPDGREIDVEPILRIVEETLHHAIPDIDGAINGTHHEQTGMLEEQPTLIGFDGVLKSLAHVIHKISCELSCKCSGGADAHASAMAILSLLSNHTWEAKVGISLAAFSVNFGEFWLVAQLFATNPLAKSIALIKQLPDIIEHSHSLKPRLDAINNLLKAMMDVTKCIVAFTKLPPQYISDEVPPKSTALAHIPTATYWTIRSMVACASQLASLLGMNYEHITATSEAWELSSLAHKLQNIYSHLKAQLSLCYQNINERKRDEYFQMLVRMFDAVHLDNMKILKALICSKDDVLPLLDCSSKTRVNIEVLRSKTILLLISDFDLSQEELLILTHIYQESRARPGIQYEVVWLPVVNSSITWNETHKQKLDQLQSTMKWYTVDRPWLLEPAVTNYIKDVWHFEKKQILVVLDPHGKVRCPNALHMMWIWGNLAYPFTSVKEEELWKEETWRLELLVDGINRNILQWVVQGKFICLYGGEDIEWIRVFTATAKRVAQEAGIDMEMIYVGKSGAKERIRKVTGTINAEKLSHTWPDLTSVWYFWTRLESMLYSKLQHGRTVENDHIMQEVMTMMSFDGSDQGWALISRGPADQMARAKADLVLTSLTEFKAWEERAKEIGFVPALNDYLRQLHTPQHCTRLILPGITTVGIPEMVTCAECRRPMDKFFMYRCCTTET